VVSTNYNKYEESRNWPEQFAGSKFADWWFKPFEKYARQIGSFSQGSGVKIPKILETTT